MKLLSSFGFSQQLNKPSDLSPILFHDPHTLQPSLAHFHLQHIKEPKHIPLLYLYEGIPWAGV
ncbi:hypothetical protein CORMATOL_01650 [Corynebacterium matruchotii ATCC 33806]|uniref:Uncharacterized protein n=1 Tax=Corynebacterium matruchotii ATCC 33806 TaxID=566549 RepID=C0E3T4_9CORY|nr:hypothetical protein CORMATOL_01650 [Corynebacterium matruchotii ATCC 33806]